MLEAHLCKAKKKNRPTKLAQYEKLLFPRPSINTRACDIFGHRFYFDALSTVFDRPHQYDVHAFSFRSTFKSVFDVSVGRTLTFSLFLHSKGHQTVRN